MDDGVSGQVDVDWSPVVKGVRQLSGGIDDGSAAVARRAAADAVMAIRARVPVRTGRLAATVDTVDIPEGCAVTYGGSLPYARYIEHRTGAVADVLVDAPARYGQAQSDMARREVRKL